MKPKPMKHPKCKFTDTKGDVFILRTVFRDETDSITAVEGVDKHGTPRIRAIQDIKSVYF